MSPPIQQIELQAAIDGYDHWWFDTFPEVRIIIRDHVAGELWPWSLEAGAQIAVTREAGRLRVRVVRMRAREDDLLA